MDEAKLSKFKCEESRRAYHIYCNLPRVVDLFAGTGAFSLAFKHAGARPIFANDIIESAECAYNRNFIHKLTRGNICDLVPSDIPDCEIITGGFPCQPFSIAGHRRGFNDPRANVFWAIMNIVDAKRPKCIVLENVKNLQTHDEGRTFGTIIDALKSRGYQLFHKVLDTCKITTTPQHRERIYIVGFRADINCAGFSLDFDNITHKDNPLTVFDTRESARKYIYSRENADAGILSMIESAVVQSGAFYQFRRVYVRENKSGVCPTLTANMGTGGHNVPIILDTTRDGQKIIRKLTPRECFNLQGFPQFYRLPVLPNGQPLSNGRLYSLAGNAVSYPVVSLIARRVVRVLDMNQSESDPAGVSVATDVSVATGVSVAIDSS